MAKKSRARQRRARQQFTPPSSRGVIHSPPSGRARDLSRIGRRRLGAAGLETRLFAGPALRRHQVPAFSPTRLRSLVVFRGSTRIREIPQRIVNRIRFGTPTLERTRSVCDQARSRREVLFSRGNAGSSWGNGSGPYPSSMRNKVLTGCKRR